MEIRLDQNYAVIPTFAYILKCNLKLKNIYIILFPILYIYIYIYGIYNICKIHFKIFMFTWLFLFPNYTLRTFCNFY